MYSNVKLKEYIIAVANKIKNLLWGNAGGICSFPNCNKRLSENGSNIGEVCHIISRKPNGPRGKFRTRDIDIDGYDNLILMCQVHHKIIDDQEENYPINKLKEYRVQHETMIKNKLSKSNSFYNDLAINFGNKIQDIGFNWLHSLPEADMALKIDEYNKLYSLINWINSRDWIINNSNITLELLFKKLAENIYQTLKTFEEHLITINNYYNTEKFYQNVDFYSNPELREQLQKKYDEHIYKLIDLTIEIAQNFNAIFRNIRQTIDSNFLLSIGIIPSLHGRKLV